MIARARTGREGGFTLIEVVIAMTLLAILMLALSGSIGFVGRSWDKAWGRSERMGALARVDEVTRRTIENAFPAVIQEGAKQRFLFTGDAQSLRLAAYEGMGRSAGGFYAIEIGVAPDTGALTYRRRPFQPATHMAAGAGDAAILLPADFTFAFSYFGAPRAKMAPAWYPSWDYPDRLPDLVRLDILANGVAAWPPIVAVAAVNAEYACLSGDGICRAQEPAP